MRYLDIVVADNHPIFVEGLRSILTHSSGDFSCRLRAVARTGNQLQPMLEEHPSDVLVLDPSLPEVGGVEMLPGLKEHFSNLRVLIMTAQNDPRLVKAALKAGADGYLLKSTSGEELRYAIQEISEGHRFLGKGVATSGPSANGHAETPLIENNFAKKYHLTRRELEIMRYIGQAMTNKEIGDRLYISDQTVSVHRKNIMRKLKVNSTASLVKIIFEHNLADTAV